MYAQLKAHVQKVRVEGVLGNNLRSVIDLKGAFKLIMLLPKAGMFRTKIAEVIESTPNHPFNHSNFSTGSAQAGWRRREPHFGDEG